MKNKHKLDLSKDKCPMTFVKTVLELEELNPKDILEITLTDKQAYEDLPKSLLERDHKIISTENNNNTYIIIVEK
jgi:TusA-related sulfurtransferase